MFEPGEKVVCVDDQRRTGYPEVPPQLKRGNFYTIKEVGIVPGFLEDAGGYYVRIEEIDTRSFSGSIGFHTDRFQKIPKKETSIEIFQKLLNPVPETVDA